MDSRYKKMLVRDEQIVKILKKNPCERASTIAKQLGCTRATVYLSINRAIRAGKLSVMPSEARVEDLNEKIDALTKEGKSAKWIADNLGVSISRVYEERHELHERD